MKTSKKLLRVQQMSIMKSIPRELTKFELLRSRRFGPQAAARGFGQLAGMAARTGID